MKVAIYFLQYNELRKPKLATCFTLINTYKVGVHVLIKTLINKIVNETFKSDTVCQKYILY